MPDGPHRIYFVMYPGDKPAAFGPVSSWEVAHMRAKHTDGILVEVPTRDGLDEAAWSRAIDASGDDA